MTALELYRYVQNKEIDWRGEQLILWIPPYDLDEFAQLLGYNYLSEGGIEVHLVNNGLIAVNLVDICENFEIDATCIHSKE